MRGGSRLRMAALAGGAGMLAMLSMAWACTVLAPHVFQPVPALTACTQDSGGPNGYQCQPVKITAVGGHIDGLDEPGETAVLDVYQNTINPGIVGFPSPDPIGSCGNNSTEIGSIAYTAVVPDPAGDPNDQVAVGVGEATPQVASDTVHAPNSTLLYRMCEEDTHTVAGGSAGTALIAIAKLGS